MQKHISSSKSIYLTLTQGICHSFSLATHKILDCGFYNFGLVNPKTLDKALGIVVSSTFKKEKPFMS